MDGGELTENKSPDSSICQIGLALSGGGSRAIAFHLGCLRALNTSGVLENIDVISTVSGGSVIGAMYAYSNDSFTSFDDRVCSLLRKGLHGASLKRLIRLDLLLGSLFTILIAGSTAIVTELVKISLEVLWRAPAKSLGQMPPWLSKINSPIPRWISRTNALERTLKEEVFGNLKMTSERRNGVNIVINACELRTATAFRFGSKESAGWRFGSIKGNEILVASAVTASAAYPILLPALDTQFNFVNKSGESEVKRVSLTDGGIYDNLGTSCMEPGRTDEFSFNVFKPQNIICCYAGHGQLDDSSFPSIWPTRMIKAFGATFKRAQDMTLNRLHSIQKSGEIDSLILAYLGQQDSKLVNAPSDLVLRKNVGSYPTDFAPMKEIDIELLTKRGEQLMNMALRQYGEHLLKLT